MRSTISEKCPDVETTQQEVRIIRSKLYKDALRDFVPFAQF